MKTNFWLEFLDRLESQPELKATAAKAADRLCAHPESTERLIHNWRGMAVPPKSIGVLMALVEAIGCEITIKSELPGAHLAVERGTPADSVELDKKAIA